MLCRRKGCDIVFITSGIHAGVQRRIKDINPKTIFVLCGSHSLNLAGVHSVGSLEMVDRFFAVLERVYTFFAASTSLISMCLFL